MSSSSLAMATGSLVRAHMRPWLASE